MRMLYRIFSRCRAVCVLMAFAACVHINSAESDQTLSEFQRNLLATSVVVYSPNDPRLSCSEFDGQNLGCAGFGSGVAVGRSQEGDVPAGIVLTNSHVTSGREVVFVFVPRLKNIEEYNLHVIQEALERYNISHSWLGGGVAGDTCSEDVIYLDRSAAPPRKRIGSVFRARVIAEHKTSDLAIIQSCTYGLKPIRLESREDCRRLDVNDPIYTVGSSPRFGHVTWLLGNFIECDENEIRYVLPAEAGRSGSPLVTEDGAIMGIHAGVAPDGEYRVGVPIRKAFELLDELRIVRSVRLVNPTSSAVNILVKCTENALRWTPFVVSAQRDKNIMCKGPAYAASARDRLPPYIHIRFDDPSTRVIDHRECSLNVRARYFVPSSIGGTDWSPKHDSQEHVFRYKKSRGSSEFGLAGC